MSLTFQSQSSRMPMVKIGDVAKIENVNLKFGFAKVTRTVKEDKPRRSRT